MPIWGPPEPTRNTRAAPHIGALTSASSCFKTGGFKWNAKKSVQFRIQLSKTGTSHLPSHNNIQSPLKEPKSACFLIFRVFFNPRLISCVSLKESSVRSLYGVRTTNYVLSSVLSHRFSVCKQVAHPIRLYSSPCRRRLNDPKNPKINNSYHAYNASKQTSFIRK